MNMQYKEYSPEVLKKLQNTQLGILKDFISVCEKHNLRYFVQGGTLIGVIRHKGFIPWDDDVDVNMPREDYNKFLSIIEEEMGDTYKILTPLVDNNYACNVTHLQKKGTKFVPYVSKDMKCDLCIDIDIFPMDKVPADRKKAQRQLKRTWFLSKLLFLCGTGEPIIPLNGVAKVIAAMICKMAHMGLKMLHISPRMVYQALQKESTRYNDTDSTVWNTFEDACASKTYLYEHEMFPTEKMPFEGVMVDVPKGYDAYLTRAFGDYMQLPPVEKRVNHCPYILEFGDEA